MSKDRNTGRRRVKSFYEELLEDDPKEKARKRLEARAAARELDADDASGASASRVRPARSRGSHASCEEGASLLDRMAEAASSVLWTAGSAVSRAVRFKVPVGSADVPLWAIVLASAALVVVALSFVRGYRDSDAIPQVAEPVEQEEVLVQQEATADFSKLPEGLDEDVVASLESQAEGNAKLISIINDADVLAFQGEETQRTLLKLAANEPLSYDFVLGINERYPSDTAQAYQEPVTVGSVPLLLQWDTRWGYTEYSSAPLGVSGCCPTTLSMVYMGLTGKTDKTPSDMAMLARERGYETENLGTIASFLVDCAADVGLYGEQFAPDASMLTDYLEAGWPVIINVGKGDFTETGHFIVACGIADDGGIVVNDPYSPTRSSRTWFADVLVSQAMGMYAFSV